MSEGSQNIRFLFAFVFLVVLIAGSFVFDEFWFNSGGGAGGGRRKKM